MGKHGTSDANTRLLSRRIEVDLPVAFDGEIGGKATKVVDARQLHACLMVPTVFATRIRRRLKDRGLLVDVDYVIIRETRSRPTTKSARQAHMGKRKTGKPEINYTISLLAAYTLAAGERTTISKPIVKHLHNAEIELRIESRLRAADQQNAEGNKTDVELPLAFDGHLDGRHTKLVDARQLHDACGSRQGSMTGSRDGSTNTGCGATSTFTRS